MIGFLLKGAITKKAAAVSKAGELAVSPISYSTPIPKTFAVADTAYNFVKPRAGFRVVITSISLFASRNVGVNDATVVIYEADSAILTTALKTIYTTEMLKQSRADLGGLHLITSEGVWINGKTNDSEVFALIGAYYVPANINTSLFIEV